MTPQEYIDRERRRAYTNLKRANERKDASAQEKLLERMGVLEEIERLLAWMDHRTETIRLLKAALEVLAAEDSGDAGMEIAAIVDGVQYTMQDLVFGIAHAVTEWEEYEEA